MRDAGRCKLHMTWFATTWWWSSARDLQRTVESHESEHSADARPSGISLKESISSNDSRLSNFRAPRCY